MERKFLENLGLEKETIDKILDQNMTEIGTYTTRLKTKEAEVSTLRDDLAAANGKIAEFEKVDVQKLQDDLTAEKAARAKDKQSWNLKSVLVSAGCKDPEYVMWKLGESVEFLEDGNIKDGDSLIESCKTNFASQFDALKEEHQESHAQTGVRLTSGGDHGSGGSPDYDSMSDEEYYSAVLKSK